MMSLVPSDVPHYMSEGTKKHCLLKYRILSTIKENKTLHDLCLLHLALLSRTKVIMPYSNGDGLCQSCISNVENVGDITIKAFDVPHSAFGSIMLLVEAEGKRVLHTGDFKREGLGVDFLEQIKKVGKVDIVITEGTMLKRSQTIKTEEEVSREMVEVMRKYKYVFVLTSSLNFDRLSSTALAAEATKKPFCASSTMMYNSIKAYMSAMPDKFCKTVTFYPFNNNNLIRDKARQGNRKYLSTYKKMKKFEDWIDSSGFVQCVSVGNLKKVSDMLTLCNQDDCVLIYSMWPGYYKIPEQARLNPNFSKFREMFKHIYDIHTSGHADIDTIAEMLELLNPAEGIIGIHKEADAFLSSLNISEELKTKIIPERKTVDYVTII